MGLKDKMNELSSYLWKSALNRFQTAMSQRTEMLTKRVFTAASNDFATYTFQNQTNTAADDKRNSKEATGL